MTDSTSADDLKTSSIVSAVLVLVLVIGIGASLISVYVDRERQRDLQQWEARLGLVADTKIEALQARLDADQTSLGELAFNASVQLYLSRAIAARGAGADSTAEASLGYLRNLLTATAERTGFVSATQVAIPANLPRPVVGGLGLYATDLSPVVTTAGMPALAAPIADAARTALADGTPQISEFQRDSQGRVVYAYALPVQAVLGTEQSQAATPVGVVVGLRDAAVSLFPALASGGVFAQQSESLLLALSDGEVVYVSPTRDGAAPMRRRMPADRDRLAAAAALQKPGRFVQLDNYAGEPVLQVSRGLRDRNWVVAQQVDARQALAEADSRRRFLTTSLSLLLISVVALYIAAWRHGSSVRSRHRADELSEQASKLHRQTMLLHALTDNLDALTLLVDPQWKIVFTNEAVARLTGAEIQELLGQRVHAALGSAVGRSLQVGAELSRQSGESDCQPLKLQFNGDERSYQASFIAVDKLGDLANATLIVLTDVTELQFARVRHARLLDNLVATLAQVIDLHDAYSAFHSARMAEVADELAAELRMSDADRQTLHFAATLANIGKIMLPRDILMKTGELEESERKLLETHVARGMELLHSLDFEGPVLSTIAQKQELLDGSGYPRGLQGSEMSLPGKVLAVSNAFVALVSPRAYREALTVNGALDALMQEADVKYDRHVLAALFHVAENRIDWSRWSRRQPANDA